MVENNQSDISIDVFNNLSKDYNLIPIFKILDNYISRGKEIESFFNPLMELFRCSKNDIISSLV